MMLVRRGDWNDVRGFLGQPGSGKTTKMVQVACEYVDKAYILAHDPNLNLPTRLPNKTKVPLIRHENLMSVRHAIAVKPRGIHAVDCDASELAGLAKEIAKFGLKKRGENEYGTPVILIIDEIVAWREAGRSKIGPVLEDLLARRRPHHVALWFTAQYPRMMHYSLLSQSTELHLGQVADKKDVDRLSDGGVPDEVLVRLPQRPHEFIVYKR